MQSLCEGIWLTDRLLQPQECDEWIQVAETQGFQPAHQIVLGRHNCETFLERADFISLLHTRFHDQPGGVPFSVTAFSRKMEFYRYRPGDFVAPHRDAPSELQSTKLSSLSLLLYLNDDFEGGVTRFLEKKQSLRPEKGQAVLFEHPFLYESAKVTRGTKYSLRMSALV